MLPSSCKCLSTFNVYDVNGINVNVFNVNVIDVNVFKVDVFNVYQFFLSSILMNCKGHISCKAANVINGN